MLLINTRREILKRKQLLFSLFQIQIQINMQKQMRRKAFLKRFFNMQNEQNKELTPSNKDKEEENPINNETPCDIKSDAKLINTSTLDIIKKNTNFFNLKNILFTINFEQNAEEKYKQLPNHKKFAILKRLILESTNKTILISNDCIKND